MPLDIEFVREYCLRKKSVTEEFPFGPETLVFKVNGKIFLLSGLDEKPFSFNVKCNPDRAIELREKYEEVTPGYHMNKKHWNTVNADGRISAKELLEMIDHSYNLVAQSSSHSTRRNTKKKK